VLALAEWTAVVLHNRALLQCLLLRKAVLTVSCGLMAVAAVLLAVAG
jgi:hypothetical protein